MPEGAVYVGRPTKWGNPWRHSQWKHDLRRRAVHLFERWLNGSNRPEDIEERRLAIMKGIGELRGKDLACWCPLDEPCHADVLLELANN